MITIERARMLGVIHGRVTKLQLFEKLHGEKLNNLEAVAAAATAFSRLKALQILVPADFPQLLKLMNESPRNRWEEYYSGTEMGSFYNGPFGSLEPDSRQESFDEIARLEEEADAPIEERISILVKDIKTYIASHSSTSRDILITLFKESDHEIKELSRKMLLSRGLATAAEILDIELGYASAAKRVQIVSIWPVGSQIMPDIYDPVFPLRRCGHQSRALSPVNNHEEYYLALNNISRYTREQMETGSLDDFEMRRYSLLADDGNALFNDLILTSHQFRSFGSGAQTPTAQQIISYFRARGALKAAEASYGNDYHDLAYLYYVASFGVSTLGADKNSLTIANALRNLKLRQIFAPIILVLGFSSIYSLENLGAILQLVGFKNAAIVALDISDSPIKKAQEHFGDSVFGFPIDYVKGDALDLHFADDTFNLVMTHLFLAHIDDRLKGKVFTEARRVLAAGGEFIDEEIVMPKRFDQDQYQSFYATLGDEFPGSSDDKYRVRQHMWRFGGHSIFYPYTDERALKNDITASGLAVDLSDKDTRRVSEHEKAATYQIRARKISP
ncbi:hypothetical protein A3H38_05280 [candidate division WOR-1 bacterium RIFCSPLOWO2_02_FULL_46_20]|uniref:Methyltransferase type 11 domain-containing protein n=1 Tax=candidate division WOR-1 bacterium RIFCSPLOWO2_02_FULL_46_20 TaxID=1802567 RepID=A0A1F4R5Y0_UNCSA|nr:MAG: hypothetical protein A3H38_05280 [candidate division WOR-1 bacterium RIFCSPLOWO2_02_FULL_46_20]